MSENSLIDTQSQLYNHCGAVNTKKARGYRAVEVTLSLGYNM